MKKNLFILILFLFSIPDLMAEDNEWNLRGYKLYEYRIESICNTYKPEKMILSSISYTDYDSWQTQNQISDIIQGIQQSDGNDLQKAKIDYKNHINDVYKCGLLSSQSKAYKLVLEDLSRYSPELMSVIQPKIEHTIKRLELSWQNLSCVYDDSKDNLHKKRVLQQATYELCKYNSYLEYLKSRNQYIQNLAEINQANNQSFSGSSLAIAQISALSQAKQNAIQNEINRVYKIFPIAFQAYSEYENNFAMHVLLELIRDDFYTYRVSLHKTINPINQLVYKISNAMKLK